MSVKWMNVLVQMSMGLAMLSGLVACEGEPCIVDADCVEGAICEDDVCVQGCRLDEDCRIGMICEMDECEVGCRSNDDCDDGEACSPVSDTCYTCSPGLYQCPCSSDGTCSGALTCQSGICLY